MSRPLWSSVQNEFWIFLVGDPDHGAFEHSFVT